MLKVKSALNDGLFGIIVFCRKQVTCLCVSMDGANLISGSDDCNVKIWDVFSGQCIKTLDHKGIYAQKQLTILKYLINLLSPHKKSYPYMNSRLLFVSKKYYCMTEDLIPFTLLMLLRLVLLENMANFNNHQVKSEYLNDIPTSNQLVL